MRGRSTYLKREHNDRAWLAWHIAYLPRAKKPVKLKALQSPEQKRDPVPWKAQLAAWQAYAARTRH